MACAIFVGVIDHSRLQGQKGFACMIVGSIWKSYMYITETSKVKKMLRLKAHRDQNQT